MARVQNVDLSYNDILHAVESSEKIQASLEKRIELEKEAEKYRKAQAAHTIRNPILRLINEFLKKYLHIDLSPAPKVPDDLMKQIAEQKKIFDNATKDVLNTIQKMEYVRMVQLGLEQTSAENLMEKYQISDTEKFKETILNEYDTHYRTAMEINETPLQNKDIDEWQLEEQNRRKTQVRDDLLQQAHRLQLNINTGERTHDADGNFHQKFVINANGAKLEGDLYSPEDMKNLRSELDNISISVDRLLNTEFKEHISEIKELQERAEEVGCFIQVSQDGVLSLSYFDDMGNEHVPYSVTLEGNETEFFKECMENIEIREQELAEEHSVENVNVLNYEESFPISSDLDEKLNELDAESQDNDFFADFNDMADMAESMDY